MVRPCDVVLFLSLSPYSVIIVSYSLIIVQYPLTIVSYSLIIVPYSLIFMPYSIIIVAFIVIFFCHYVLSSDHYVISHSLHASFLQGTSSFEGFKSQSEAFLHYAKQKGVTVVACEGAFEGYEPDDSMAMDEHKLLLSNTEPTTVAKAVKKRVVKKITAAAISLSAFKPISIIDS